MHQSTIPATADGTPQREVMIAASFRPPVHGSATTKPGKETRQDLLAADVMFAVLDGRSQMIGVGGWLLNASPVGISSRQV